MTDDDSQVRHLFSAIEAEQHLGVKASTVRSWASRRLIWSYGLNGRLHPMYDRDDLVAMRDKNGSRDRRRSRQVPPRRGSDGERRRES